jgi:hypothetical protein
MLSSGVAAGERYTTNHLPETWGESEFNRLTVKQIRDSERGFKGGREGCMKRD